LLYLRLVSQLVGLAWLGLFGLFGWLSWLGMAVAATGMWLAKNAKQKQ